MYRYVGNKPTTHIDPSGNEEISVIHGTTPGGAISIVQTGLQAGKDGGIWLSTHGGGVAEGATVQMNYNVNISNAREISDEVIKESQKAANAAVKGLSGEARSASWARAKGDYLAKWAYEQGDQVFKMKAPPPYQGYHYYIKPAAWKGLSPKLVSITGEGAEQAVKAIAAGQVADEALAAASAAAKAKWAGRAVTALRIGGRVVIVVSIAASGYEIYTAEDKWKETAKQGAGLGGGAACAYAGGAIGSTGGPVGIGVGAVIGGIIGYFAGSQAGENYYEFVFEPGALIQ